MSGTGSARSASPTDLDPLDLPGNRSRSVGFVARCEAASDLAKWVLSMLHLTRWCLPLTVVLAVPGGSALAQYNYPPGYSGWGGWGGGGSTVQGNIAAGMGNFAAGAGAYNVQTSQARAQNANTAMQVNDYMYAINQRNAASFTQRQAGKIKQTNEAADATYRRLHDNPSPADIHSGDALNVVLTELTNPSVYTQVVQKATTPIDSQLVKNINFQHAADMILISLDDVSARGVPDVLANDPAFESDRQAIRAIVAKGKKEAESASQVSDETLRSFRAAVKTVQDKVAGRFPQGTRQRDEADNYLKALYGLSKMLERPAVEQFLKGLNRYPTTTLGHLISFMHSFNLRFGVSKNGVQQATYDQIYPMLVSLRNQAQGPSPAPAPVAMPDPKKLTTFFSGMDYSHFQSQPDPHTGSVPPPPPPQPGAPR
jgi:hypothetical protein